MNVTHQFVTEPHDCAYLAGRKAELHYSYAPELSPQEYEALMNAGCRKFGLAFFRPVCAGCQACRPIRFDVSTFTPDRSQKRALKRNADLAVQIAEPICDEQRLELFRRYHEFQAGAKHWPRQGEGPLEYEFSFVQNQIPGLEISAWDGDKLLGVMLTEITPNVVSAVYHYHEPEQRERGLGTFLILQCAELARQIGRRWVYLGYYVKDSPSMAYKTRFGPCEVLGVDGVWRDNEI